MRIKNLLALVLALSPIGCAEYVSFTSAGVQASLNSGDGNLPDQDAAEGETEEENPTMSQNPTQNPNPGPPAPPQCRIMSPSANEIADCRKVLGDRVVLVSAQKNGEMKLSEGQALVVKVAGNQKFLDLRLNSDGGQMAGLCVIVTGNQNRARVAISGALKNALYLGTGNQSAAELILLAEGDVAENFQARLSGNQSSLKVSGPEGHPCPTVKTSGNSAGVKCE